jgi:hypothetical protein
MPRYMVIVKATPESEAGVMPAAHELGSMGRFNDRLTEAGAMLAGEGLHPSSKGSLVSFAAGTPVVTDGPFAEAKELVAGFWILELGSLDDVIGWMKEAPFHDAELEIRPFYEADDFGDVFTPEQREKEAALRAQTEGKA